MMNEINIFSHPESYEISVRLRGYTEDSADTRSKKQI